MLQMTNLNYTKKKQADITNRSNGSERIILLWLPESLRWRD